MSVLLVGEPSSAAPSTNLPSATAPSAAGIRAAWRVLLRLDPKLANLLDQTDRQVAFLVGMSRGDPNQLVRLLERKVATTLMVASLWRYQHVVVDSTSRNAWTRAREVAFATLGFPAWQVPSDPTWQEDPFRNVSWRTRYESLEWLTAPADAYRQSGDRRYIDQIVGYLVDWIRTNGDPRHATQRAWYDHAVALRTDAIIYLLRILPAGAVDASDFRTILTSLAMHGRVLDKLLDNPAFRGHNHGLFHAMSLYNLATSFPELRGSRDWLAHARERLRDIPNEMVSATDGVDLEQAPSYHYLAMTLFEAAANYLRARENVLAAAFEDRVRLMTLFGAAMITPTGVLPAFGDTPYGVPGGRAIIDEAIRRGLATPAARYLVTGGQDGARPADMLVFPEGGYAILRPSYGETGAWRDDLQVVMDVGAARRVHGHEDALSFTMFAYGEPLIIDPGGPYLYGSETQGPFIGAAAHNSVLVQGATPSLGSVNLIRSTDTPRFSIVVAEVGVTGGPRHRRTLILVKPTTLVVVDELQNVPAGHGVELRYHLPPGAQLVGSGSTRLVRVGGALMRLQIAAKYPDTIEVHAGGEGPTGGWVTPSYNRRVAAPVITAAQLQPGWFVSVLTSAHSASDLASGLSVTNEGSAITISIRFPRGPATTLVVTNDQMTLH